MEQVPGAKAQIREMAQANANPETKTVDRKVKVAWETTGDEAREKTKAQAAARVEDKNRDKAAGGRPEYFHGNNLSRMQHWEAAFQGKRQHLQP